MQANRTDGGTAPCTTLVVRRTTRVVQHTSPHKNVPVLPVVVVKLMGVALGIALMDPTHRYAGLTPHLTP